MRGLKTEKLKKQAVITYDTMLVLKKEQNNLWWNFYSTILINTRFCFLGKKLYLTIL